MKDSDTDYLPVRLVSLSHVNDPATTNIYPGDPPFELETVANSNAGSPG